MAQNSGAPILVAALILGASVLVSALLIRSSIDDAAMEVANLGQSFSDLQVAGPTPPPNRPTRAGRPDPSRRYTVKTEGSPVRGNAKAKVSIVEFSDFQCPFCSRVGPTLKQISQEYGDDVRIVFKHLPLKMHTKAPAAHAAAEAAHQQGKFWEMHDKIFANPRDLSDQKYQAYATELGLDLTKFNADRKSAATRKRVDSDSAEAATLGVTGTPAFFVNGRFLSGAQPFASFKTLIDAELGRG